MSKFANGVVSNELLELIHRAGFMGCDDLSQFTKKELSVTEEAVQTLLNQKLIISKTLPEGAGDVFYLSSKGASHLKEHGLQVDEIYKLDRFVDDEWKCPSDWKHHLLSLGAISRLIETSGEALEYFFEREIRRAYPYLAKYPDGVVIDATTTGIWIECERSSKVSQKLVWMCQAIIDASNNNLPSLFGKRFKNVIVCVDPNERDSNGHRINHIKRVVSKLATMVKEPINFKIAKMTVDKHRVLAIETIDTVQNRDEVQLALKRLELLTWMTEDFFTQDKRTLAVSGNDWAGQFTPTANGSFFWEVGIIDYDDTYNHFGPSQPSRQVEEGLDVFKSGYATSANACKRAIAEVIALLISNGVTLHSIW